MSDSSLQEADDAISSYSSDEVQQLKNVFKALNPAAANSGKCKELFDLLVAISANERIQFREVVERTFPEVLRSNPGTFMLAMNALVDIAVDERSETADMAKRLAGSTQNFRFILERLADFKTQDERIDIEMLIRSVCPGDTGVLSTLRYLALQPAQQHGSIINSIQRISGEIPGLIPCTEVETVVRALSLLHDDSLKLFKNHLTKISPTYTNPDELAEIALALVKKTPVIGGRIAEVLQQIGAANAVPRKVARAINQFEGLKSAWETTAVSPDDKIWLANALITLPWHEQRGIALENNLIGPRVVKALIGELVLFHPADWPKAIAQTLAFQHADADLHHAVDVLKWLKTLEPESRKKLPRSSVVSRNGPLEEIDVAILRSLASLPGNQTVTDHWSEAIEVATRQVKLDEPWSVIPLDWLMRSRDAVRSGLKKSHAEAFQTIVAKGFDRANPVHQLISHYEQLQLPHMQKYLLLQREKSDSAKLGPVGLEAITHGLRNPDFRVTTRTAFHEDAKNVKFPDAAFLAYEAYLVDRDVLRPLEKRATSIGITKVVEFVNLTSGGTNATPMDLHKRDSTWTGTSDPIIHFVATKQGSTEARTNQLGDHLLNLECWTRIFDRLQLPLISVLDSAPLVNRLTNFPDAFHMWHQVAILINLALGCDPRDKWRRRGIESPEFTLAEDYPDLVELVMSLGEPLRNGSAPMRIFDLHYCSMDDTTASVKSEVGTPLEWTPPKFDIEDVRGPGMVLIQMGMNLPTIQRRADSGDVAARFTLDKIDEWHAVQPDRLASPISHKSNPHDDSGPDQDPWRYEAASGRIMIKPRVHPPSRAFFKQIERHVAATDAGYRDTRQAEYASTRVAPIDASS